MPGTCQGNECRDQRVGHAILHDEAALYVQRLLLNTRGEYRKTRAAGSKSRCLVRRPVFFVTVRHLYSSNEKSNRASDDAYSEPESFWLSRS